MICVICLLIYIGTKFRKLITRTTYIFYHHLVLEYDTVLIVEQYIIQKHEVKIGMAKI